MKNIWKVFKTDAKRLSTNVVALVIVMGLSIIPALYAWFNIMSNWDPYGTSATSKMKIAVYSLDAGFTVGDTTICIGDTVLESLEANDTIAWQFPETEEETLEGVYSGEYYAALVIPENFTVDMLSFIGGDPENPQIEYYENSKKNAIATKITSKVKTTVQQSVNSAVISKIAEIATAIGETVTGTDAEGGSVLGGTISQLESMDQQLENYSNILSTLATLSQSSSELIGSANDMIPSVEGMISAGSASVAGMQKAALAGTMTAQTLTSMVDLSLNTVSGELDNLQTMVENLDVNVDYSKLEQELDSIENTGDTIFSLLESLPVVGGSDYQTALADAKTKYAALIADAKTFSTDAQALEDQLETLQPKLKTEVDACQSSIESLKRYFDYSVAPSLSDSMFDIQSALIDTQTMLGNLDNDFPLVSSALTNYQDILEEGSAGIQETVEYIDGVREELSPIIDALKIVEGDSQYSEIVELLQTDPEAVSAFVTSPVTMETEAIYEIETYGSAMAPFYTVLGLWVGGLICVALLHVKVKDCPEVEGTNEVERFFGRYLVFFFVAEAQTLITVFGDLFFVQIQCVHPVLFYVGCAVMSLMFSFFMYALTYAWGNIGQALAVVIMVIQVAGAGGTFPIEVLPKAYQMVYRFLPFTYAMNALRECVGGSYRLDYLKDLGVLGIYILISVPLGLFCGKPFKKLISQLEKSKEKTGIMM